MLGGQLRIAAISDIHGMLPPPCEEVDLVIIAGDICPDLRPIERQGSWFIKEFGGWLKTLPADFIIMTWGNHDFIGEDKRKSDELGYMLPKNADLYRSGEVTVNGKTIYCFPYVPNLPRWAFSGEGETRVEAHVNDIPENIDILVTHGPPQGIGDDLPGAHHVGSRALRNRCAEVHPPVHICGHIHEAGGRSYLPPWGGILYNVASLEGIGGHYQPRAERWTYIDIPNG
jgi:Icc-related predicted phosphoesterase